MSHFLQITQRARRRAKLQIHSVWLRSLNSQTQLSKGGNHVPQVWRGGLGKKCHHNRSLQDGYLENHNRDVRMFQKGIQGEQKTVAMMMVCANQ